MVIPAAGEGKRFREAGYDKIKPLIDVLGKPMITRVIENVSPPGERAVTVISQLPLDEEIPANIFYLRKPTGGAAQTILATEGTEVEITKDPLVMANCDQLVGFPKGGSSVMAAKTALNNLDGCITTFRSARQHHSYVKLSDQGIITDIAEKEVISNHAVTGVYFFRNGRDFVDACRHIVLHDIRVKGEYYVSSALKCMIENGRQLGVYDAPAAMLGTPDELDLYLMAHNRHMKTSSDIRRRRHVSSRESCG